MLRESLGCVLDESLPSPFTHLKIRFLSLLSQIEARVDTIHTKSRQQNDNSLQPKKKMYLSSGAYCEAKLGSHRHLRTSAMKQRKFQARKLDLTGTVNLRNTIQRFLWQRLQNLTRNAQSTSTKPLSMITLICGRNWIDSMTVSPPSTYGIWMKRGYRWEGARRNAARSFIILGHRSIDIVFKVTISNL